MRPIYLIAEEIRKTWIDKAGKSKVYFGAVPYLEAMECLVHTDDIYGLDSARDIVMYFLSNATTFRGEDARRIKAELKEMFNFK